MGMQMMAIQIAGLSGGPRLKCWCSTPPTFSGSCTGDFVLDCNCVVRNVVQNGLRNAQTVVRCSQGATITLQSQTSSSIGGFSSAINRQHETGCWVNFNTDFMVSEKLLPNDDSKIRNSICSLGK